MCKNTFVLFFSSTELPIAVYQEDNEEDAEAHDQVTAAAVIAGAELTVALLTQVLDTLGSISRKIAIGISNEGSTVWSTPGVYHFSGTSDTTPPYKVKPNQAMIYEARKTTGPVARGAVGVIGYRMSDGNTIAVMFSVPFDYNLYENQWNARVYPGKVLIGKNLYEDLYHGHFPFKGDDSWHEKNIGRGYHVRGVMSSSGTSTLNVHITQY